MNTPKADWYQDPQDPQGLRYWDGTQWTSQTHQPTQPPPPPALGGYQAPPQAPGVPAYQGYSPVQQGSYAAAPVSFPEAAKGLITKWSFRGRASRSEYWFASLAFYLFNIAAQFLTVVGIKALGYLFILIQFVAGVNLLLFAIRRYHDTGRSGWWIALKAALGIIFFVVILVAALGARDTKSALEFSLVSVVMMLLIMATSVWHIVWLCLPGKPEQNRFDD